MTLVIKKPTGSKCHTPTKYWVGPVSVHLLLHNYSKTRNSFVSLFRLNHETKEENLVTTRYKSITNDLFSRDSVFPWEQVIWYSDPNLRC